MSPTRRPQIAWERQGWSISTGPTETDWPAWPAWSGGRVAISRPEPDPDLRIGDAERDQAVADLGEHFAAGRLTREEFDDRAQQALLARRQADLEPLFRDLPVARRPESVAPRPRFAPSPMMLIPVLLLATVLTAVLSSAPWVIWLVLTLMLIGRPWRHRRRAGRVTN